MFSGMDCLCYSVTDFYHRLSRHLTNRHLYCVQMELNILTQDLQYSNDTDRVIPFKICNCIKVEDVNIKAFLVIILEFQKCSWQELTLDKKVNILLEHNAFAKCGSTFHYLYTQGTQVMTLGRQFYSNRNSITVDTNDKKDSRGTSSHQYKKLLCILNFLYLF